MLYLMYKGRAAAAATPEGAVRAVRMAAEAERTKTPLLCGGEGNEAALLHYLTTVVGVRQAEECRLSELIPQAGGLYFSKLPFGVPLFRRRGFVRRLVMPLLPVVRRERRKRDKRAARGSIFGEAGELSFSGFSFLLRNDTSRVLRALSLLRGEGVGSGRVRRALRLFLRRNGYLLTLLLGREKRARLLSKILENYSATLGGKGGRRGGGDLSAVYTLFFRELRIDVTKRGLPWQGFCALLRDFSAGKGEETLPLSEGLSRLTRGLL